MARRVGSARAENTAVRLRSSTLIEECLCSTIGLHSRGKRKRYATHWLDSARRARVPSTWRSVRPPFTWGVRSGGPPGPPTSPTWPPLAWGVVSVAASRTYQPRTHRARSRSRAWRPGTAASFTHLQGVAGERGSDPVEGGWTLVSRSGVDAGQVEILGNEPFTSSDVTGPSGIQLPWCLGAGEQTWEAPQGGVVACAGGSPVVCRPDWWHPASPRAWVELLGSVETESAFSPLTPSRPACVVQEDDCRTGRLRCFNGFSLVGGL